MLVELLDLPAELLLVRPEEQRLTDDRLGGRLSSPFCPKVEIAGQITEEAGDGLIRPFGPKLGHGEQDHGQGISWHRALPPSGPCTRRRLRGILVRSRSSGGRGSRP